MFNLEVLRVVFGILLMLTGILDAYKYIVQGRKIQIRKSAKGMSRMFINYSLINGFVRTIYGGLIFDAYIFLTSLFAMGCMFYMWEMERQYYPYRMRGCYNFKKPNIFLYIVNSFLPNNVRKRL